MDDRVKLISERLRSKHIELINHYESRDLKYFDVMAEEALKALDEYYGAARYWMSAEFAKQSILHELQTTIDRIRNADFHA